MTDPRDPSAAEVERRYAQRARGDGRARRSTRCSSAAASTRGFEGAVRYLSGFRDRPPLRLRAAARASGDPLTIFPSEARYVGEHADGWIARAGVRRAPRRLARATTCAARRRRLGVYGLDYVMTVRDYRALARRRSSSSTSTSPSTSRARSRAPRSSSSVRESMAINEAGLLGRARRRTSPAARRRELMAVGRGALRRAWAPGARRWTWSLVGPRRRRDAGVPDPRPARADRADDLLLYSLEVAGPGRPLGRVLARADARRRRAPTPQRMLEAYARVPRRRARGDARRRERPRRPPRRLGAVPRARLPARPRHRPLDRDDDDRAPEDRRGRRRRAARGHGLLDAPARDRRRRAAPACTCRTPGSSARTAASRSSSCR